MALVKNIVSNVIVVLGYEGGGQTYDPKLPNLSTLTIMDHLHGYWLKMADDDTLRLLGTFVDYNTTFIACQAGWNLVSYLPDKPDSVSHCFSSVMKDNLITALAYNGAGLTYSPALPSFSTLKVASPFLGYWLKLEQAADLLYPTPLIEYNQVINSWPALTKSISGMLPQSQSEVLLPTIEWMNLYGENLMYRGTLLAPGTVITARTEGGNICGAFTVHQAGMFGLMPVYRDDPSTDVREGPQASESFYLYFDGEKISVVLRWSSLGDAVRLAGTVTAIEDDNASLPLTSELSQNYPNPFNPQTTIAYQLHKSGFVNISVCNMLGQEVALLVCEIKPAGMHHVIWDGRDKIGTHLPSGIYYCRMTTPGFSQTQKMVILY